MVSIGARVTVVSTYWSGGFCGGENVCVFFKRRSVKVFVLCVILLYMIKWIV